MNHSVKQCSADDLITNRSILIPEIVSCIIVLTECNSLGSGVLRARGGDASPEGWWVRSD